MTIEPINKIYRTTFNNFYEQIREKQKHKKYNNKTPTKQKDARYKENEITNEYKDPNSFYV